MTQSNNSKMKVKNKKGKSKGKKQDKKLNNKKDKVATSTLVDDISSQLSAEQNTLKTKDIFRLLDLYFYREFHMYKHLYNSYDKFLDEDIKRFLLDGNHIFSETIKADTIYRNKFKFENIRYQSPAFDNKVDPIFPSDARHGSRTYSVTLIADVTQLLEKKKIISREDATVTVVGEKVKDVQLGYIPLMLRSKYCNLTQHKGIDNKECDYDPGGYFVVNGSEKVVISQDRMVENKPLVFLKKDSSSQTYVVQVNSKSYNPHALPQSLTIQLKKTNVMNIRVPILNEVNVFTLFRALGITSDRDIINYTTYNEHDRYMTNIIMATLADCKNEDDVPITTREEAYDFLINKIKVIQKHSNTSQVNKVEQKKLHLTDLLNRSFLPHISGTLKQKAIYLGYMINRLIRVALGRMPIDDRDSYLNKRIDPVGDLMFELFKQQFKKLMNESHKLFKNRTDDDNNPYNIIHHIKPNTIEQGLKASLSTGSWIRRKGVAQMLQRLTYLHSISFLRRVDAPSGDASSAKLTSPRQLHPSSIGFLCPVQTPEHAKVGLVKHLNLISSITIMDRGTLDVVTNHMMNISDMKQIDEVEPNKLKYYYKVFLNGDWMGIIRGVPKEGEEHSDNIPAIQLYNDLKERKRTGYFNPEVMSIVMDHDEFEMRVYCDTGRMYRPILKVGPNNDVLLKKSHIDKISLNKTHTGKITDWDEFVAKHNDLIEYIDMEEQPYLMVADKIATVNRMQTKMKKSFDYKFTGHSDTDIVNRYNDNYFLRYTHCEFHPAILFGEIAVNIPFIDSNQGPRNIFQYSQGRQAMGIYATNYRDRLDISYILYHPQKPVVTTRTSKYVFTETLPFGENAIVAVSTYTGYNQEDSLIFNRRSIERGMFRSTSLRKFSSSISKNQNTSQDDIFTKPDPDKVIGIRHGSYNKLNNQGFVPEETEVVNGDILLAKIKPIQQDIRSNSEKAFKDDSEVYKSFVPGKVDRVHTKILNAESYETRKMLVRSERTPHVGDKFCCYTPDHDILTYKGWKSIADVNKNDLVATLIEGKLAYTRPTDIQEFDYDGKMYVVKSNQVDLMVTPNHRMYVGSRERKNFRITTAEDCYGKMRSYMKNCNGYIAPGVDTGYIDHTKNEFILPGTDKLPEKRLFLKDWLNLFGMWIAEGCVTGGSVRFASHKERVRERLDTCGRALKIKFGLCKDHRYDKVHNSYRIYDRRFINYFEPLSVGAVKKSLPDWVWELDWWHCRDLIDGMMLGDGHTMANGTRRYDTSSTQLADDFQKLCLHAGYSCNIMVKYKAGHTSVVKAKGREGETITSTADAYRMTIIEKQNTPLVNKNKGKGKQHDEWVNYKGKVHCCTVVGPGIVYVRRNKVPVWSGNSRHGQKGTCGILLKGTDMMHTGRGITPDIILNPNAIPSRMTIGQLIECLIGKVATLKCEEADGTPFEDRNIEAIKDELKALGYRHDCTEYMYNGMTGEMMNIPIFIGPTYYNRLKHMVQDKVHARARGPRTLLTRQAPEGRSRDGGLRVGEMERDAITAHGLARLLKEKLMDNSDAYSTYVCGKCGLFAQRANRRNNKKYPQDTDIYFCQQCNNYNDIHKVMIPYAFKLMLQELMSMCIAPRIRIEKPVFDYNS